MIEIVTVEVSINFIFLIKMDNNILFGKHIMMTVIPEDDEKIIRVNNSDHMQVEYYILFKIIK